MTSPDPKNRVDRDARAAIHAAIGLVALTLPYLPRPAAAACAIVAVFGNLFILPRLAIGRRIIGAATVSWRNGIVLYPVTVLLLILILPYPDHVMAAWGILAAGDAAASWVGRRRPRPATPWNLRKSIAGFAAFPIAGFAAATLLRATIPHHGSMFSQWKLDLSASLLAALFESLPSRIDDNIRIGLATGIVYIVTSS